MSFCRVMMEDNVGTMLHIRGHGADSEFRQRLQRVQRREVFSPALACW